MTFAFIRARIEAGYYVEDLPVALAMGLSDPRKVRSEHVHLGLSICADLTEAMQQAGVPEHSLQTAVEVAFKSKGFGDLTKVVRFCEKYLVPLIITPMEEIRYD